MRPFGSPSSSPPSSSSCSPLTLCNQHIGYSYFRDEFDHIACGRHLAWGFVDHGPIVALQARLGEFLFGDSLFAIRILSALAGAATVFLTGLLAWALGGLRPHRRWRCSASSSLPSTSPWMAFSP